LIKQSKKKEGKKKLRREKKSFLTFSPEGKWHQNDPLNKMWINPRYIEEKFELKVAQNIGSTPKIFHPVR
jgi:hypothetical protein